MTDNGKRTGKTPAILILASFVIVVAGMKAAGSLRVAILRSLGMISDLFFFSDSW